jgi:hypothetical protein
MPRGPKGERRADDVIGNAEQCLAFRHGKPVPHSQQEPNQGQ